MKARDLWIGIVFIHVLLFLFLGSLGLAGSPVALSSIAVPGWLPACYFASLLAASVGVVLRQGWARLVAVLLVLPLIPLFGAPLVSARSRDILGGTGPDANPMAGVILLIYGTSAAASLLFTVFVVWLLRFRLVRNDQWRRPPG